MDRLQTAEVDMFKCSVCSSEESHQKNVQEVFQIDGKYVLVDGIPATVCMRCGEESFSRETTEKVRQLVHGRAKPVKSLPLEVFEFV